VCGPFHTLRERDDFDLVGVLVGVALIERAEMAAMRMILKFKTRRFEVVFN